jgi:hypothetical protein
MFININININGDKKMLVSPRNRLSKKALREQLVGAWVLTSYVVRDIKTASSAMATCRRNCNAPNDLCLSMEVPRALPRTNLQPREVPTSPIPVAVSSTKTRTP